MTTSTAFPTTLKTLTGSMINQLRIEAGAAGDSEMVAICNRASAGSVRAQRLVVKAIRAAEAMAPKSATTAQAIARHAYGE